MWDAATARLDANVSHFSAHHMRPDVYGISVIRTPAQLFRESFIPRNVIRTRRFGLLPLCRSAHIRMGWRGNVHCSGTFLSNLVLSKPPRHTSSPVIQSLARFDHRHLVQGIGFMGSTLYYLHLTVVMAEHGEKLEQDCSPTPVTRYSNACLLVSINPAWSVLEKVAPW